MSEVNVLLFTECHYQYSYSKANGAYRIATELRNNGYSVQVVDFFGYMNRDNINIIIKKFVGKSTLVLGFSSTLFAPSDDEIYTGALSQIDAVKLRTNGGIIHVADIILAICTD